MHSFWNTKSAHEKNSILFVASLDDAVTLEMNDSIKRAHQKKFLRNHHRFSSPFSAGAESNAGKQPIQRSFSSSLSKDGHSSVSSTSNYHDGVLSPAVPLGRPRSAYASPDAPRLQDLDLHGRSRNPAERSFTAKKDHNSRSPISKARVRSAYERRKRTATSEERGNVGSPVRIRRTVSTKDQPRKPQESGMAINPLDMDDTGAVLAENWHDAATNAVSAKGLDRSGNTQAEHHNVAKKSERRLSNSSASGMFLQPETHPITEDQLVNEVRGIYAGLVMVEKKCMEIDKRQSQSRDALDDRQWQALIALHRTLLHEHHDFFLASQHPSASLGLRRLAERYAMPARMWRYGIHSFLELLRHGLPDSLEHMLTFIYMAYSMMTLLLESVPAFQDTWIECLGDLARYRMAVEEVDMRDREVWSGVARYWYNKAADKNPDVGRIQHHLAVLARPNIVQQLFYYTKSLVSVQPFPSAKESILLLFNPLLDRSRPVSERYPAAIAAFVSAHATLFVNGSIQQFIELSDKFLRLLDNYIARSGTLFREHGVHVVCSNYAAILEYGQKDAIIPIEFSPERTQHLDQQEVYQSAREFWKASNHTMPREAPTLLRETASTKADSAFSSSEEILAHASYLSFSTLAVILQRLGDKNVLPSVHVSLAFLWCFALNPRAMLHIQQYVPWVRIASFLNTLIRSDIDMERVEHEEFPHPEPGIAAQLPEDFLIRGQMWSQLYHPKGFFSSCTGEDEERSIEFPSIIVPRTHRCLWLGMRIASLECWITYNRETRTFAATAFAFDLENTMRQPNMIDRKSKTLSPDPKDRDTKMTDV
ncbi:hypothetical protein DTO212C5_5528 [Paecilomyces variotii]|nr:hypothetical protein DTO212C5_5528 [Paecilomyces variotii]